MTDLIGDANKMERLTGRLVLYGPDYPMDGPPPQAYYKAEDVQAALEDICAVTPTIEKCLKETNYKYFGDYEFSEGQRDAVIALEVVATKAQRLLAALRKEQG